MNIESDLFYPCELEFFLFLKESSFFPYLIKNKELYFLLNVLFCDNVSI